MPKTPSAEAMPALVCVGTVAKIGEPKKSQTEGSPYWMLDIELHGMNAGKNGYTRLMLVPSWVSADFNVNRDLATKGEKFVYGKNLASAEAQKPALLTALLREDKALLAQFDEIAATAYAESNGDPETVLNAIRGFLIEATQGTLVGYVLRQRREKVGEETVEREDGSSFTRGIYFYEDKREVGSPDKYLGDFFVPSARSVRFIEGRVAKTAEAANPFYKLVMTFLPEELGL